MFRGKLCSQKDDIAVGSLFTLLVENLAHLMVNFEQAVSIDPPRVTYVDIQFFSFTAWSGRIVSTFTTSKQYACILRVQYGNESK